MIAQMESGRVPKVENTELGIAMWADADEQHGFVFDRNQAASVAVKLLAAVAETLNQATPAFDVKSIALDTPANIIENPVVRVVFTVGNAPIAATLTLDQFSDLAAHCTAASRIIDAAFPRKHDNL